VLDDAVLDLVVEGMSTLVLLLFVSVRLDDLSGTGAPIGIA
jgi:hypothetical protein